MGLRRPADATELNAAAAASDGIDAAIALKPEAEVILFLTYERYLKIKSYSRIHERFGRISHLRKYPSPNWVVTTCFG